MRSSTSRLRLQRTSETVVRRTLLCLGVIGLATASSARGQDAAGCAALLEPDIQLISSEVHVRLAYLHTLNSESYSRAKRGGSATAGIPVEGVPLSATAGWTDFSARLERESRTEKFTYDFSQSTWYYARLVPHERAQLFLECITGVNLQIKLTNRAGDDHAIWMKWNERSPNDPPVVLGFDQSRNITVLPTRAHATFQDRDERTIVFTPRDPKRDMLIVVNGGGKTATIVIAPPLVKRDETLETMACSVILNMIRDDHYTTSSDYYIDVSLDNGRTWAVDNDRINSLIPHGRPYGGSFDNWTDYRFTARIPTNTGPPRILIRLHALWDETNKDWIRINKATIECPNGKRVSKLLPIHDPSVYGPGGTRTLQVDDKGEHGDGTISFDNWER